MEAFEDEYFGKRRNWYGKTTDYSHVENLVKRKLSFAFDLLNKVQPSSLNGQGKEAITIGCGYGYEAEMIEELGFSVTGLDISKHAVAMCKKRLDHLKFLVHDISNPIPCHLVDLIVGMEILEHLTDPMKAIKNVHEGLEVGGSVIFTTPNKNSPYYPVNLIIDKTHINIKSPKEWFNLMNSLSWSLIRIFCIQWIPWIWRPIRLPVVGNSLIIIAIK
jgi:2-polyprenyl-3-methyl-5-hydroxy-6-metoxy-1,4-benzoquinol methylase